MGGADASAEAWATLSQRPGFLIRRLHQIHLALFAEECAAFGITPVQYSMLTVLRTTPDLDQGRLANELGVDRATTANVLARIERKGLIGRRRAPHDSRVKLARLTAAGKRLLGRMDEAARRAHERTIAPLPARDRARLMEMLVRLVEAGNSHSRAPLMLELRD
jgi:DNA-binding MarR family transcriptional regulator